MSLAVMNSFFFLLKVPWKFGDLALLVEVSTSSSIMDIASGTFVLQWYPCETEKNFQSRHLELQATFETSKKTACSSRLL